MYKRKYSIGIVTSGIPFNGNSLVTKSLGGSETGIIYLAKGFAARGHQVAVFCNCGEQGGEFDGVTYFDLSQWEELGSFLTLDVLIVSRFSQRLVDKCKAKAIYFYCQDIVPQGNNIHDLLWQTDRVALLSPFQRRKWDEVEPRYNPHIFEVRNGVDLDLIAKAKMSVEKMPSVPKDKINFIYSSRVERGLKPLLDMWPEILKKVPNAHLHVLNYDVSMMQELPEAKELVARCAGIISQFPDSITYHPSGLKKFDLYRIFHGCAGLLYPCAFPEVSCLTAIEAMATDTLVFTTNAYALVDTVGKDCGVLVDGLSLDDKYKKKFVNVVVQYANHGKYKERIAKAREKVEAFYSWDHVVDLWLDDFKKLFTSRTESRPQRVFQNLNYHNDFVFSYLAAVEKGHTDQEFDVSNTISRSLKVSRSLSPEPHYFPGNTPKGATIRQILSGYLAPLNGISNILVSDSGIGDISAFVCKSFPGVSVTGISDEKNTSEAKNFYHVAKESPLSGVDKVRLKFFSESIPESSELYDVYIAENVLDYVSDIKDGVRDIESRVKVGGLVVVVTKEGPWESDNRQLDPDYLSGRVSNFESEDLRDLLGHKEGFNSQFVTHKLNKKDELLSYWVTSWIKTVDTRVGVVDIERKFFTYRPYKSVTLCMIGKNEEDHVSRCLKSARSFVDDVVFVDTGSTDDTKQIVKKLIPDSRLTIVDNPWNDDFSEARNAALPHAHGDWILWMDCDEELKGGYRLPKYLNSVIFPGFIIHQHHLTLDTEIKPDKPIRLFKNNGIKWYGCVSGDTLISTPGGDIPIKDLVNKRPYIYAYDTHQNKLVVTKPDEIVKTRQNAEVLKITLDDGSFIKATPDHPFLMRRHYQGTGEYKEAKDLKPGDSLMPFYRRDDHGYNLIRVRSKQYASEHRFVYESINGPVKEGNIVHHIDGDKRNNMPSNLMEMSNEDHVSLHSKGKVLSDYTKSLISRNHAPCSGSDNSMYGRKHSEETKKKIGEKSKGRKHSQETKRKISEKSSDSNRFTWADPIVRARRIDGMKAAAARKKNLMADNHKVVSVCSAGREDVYNMEVPEVHNFIANGVVVHNCVHEQAEEGMDMSVRPTIPLEGVNVAHYGYVSEDDRRKKCFERNMSLLYKDRKQNPDRLMGKFLLAREYRNIVNYRLEMILKNHKPITREMVIMMREVCRIHLETFAKDIHSPLYAPSFSIYQETLRTMVELNVAIRDGIMGLGIKSVPFVFSGGSNKGQQPEVKEIHFLSESEYTEFSLRYLHEVSQGKE